MRNLYLRIYLTVVAVLLLFALVAGWMFQQHAERERANFQAQWGERAAGWAAQIETVLPAEDASAERQAETLQEWSERLRLPLALDDADGQRIATSESYARREARGEGAARRSIRLQLSDGRGLWILRPGPGPGPGPGAAWDGPRGVPPPFAPPSFGPLPGRIGMVVTLLVLFFAVALGAYPVVRRLTRRLETLQRGVETFGAGQLSHRVDVDGRDEVAAVANSFNAAAERVETLVVSHRQLLANASHELRSPLARLKMAVSMLDGAPAASRDALKREIEQNIRELDTLVEEVLLASRLDAQRELDTLERVDLLVLAAEEGARVGAAAGGEDVTVPGSERLLRRALRNLLENAQRYGGDREAPEVEIARDGDAVRIAVLDRGPGVPAAERERIFEPFYRLPGHAEQAGGVGLGLSLVRQIARKHGGDATVEPRDGGGSRFVIRLPLAPDTAAQLSPLARRADAARGDSAARAGQPGPQPR